LGIADFFLLANILDGVSQEYEGSIVDNVAETLDPGVTADDD